MPVDIEQVPWKADVVKNPIGVLPRKLWEEFHPNPTRKELRDRVDAILNAIDRYNAEKLPFPVEWAEEGLIILALKLRGG